MNKPMKFKFISNDGTIYQGTNLSQFARTRNLNKAHLWQVLAGNFKKSQGFRKFTKANVELIRQANFYKVSPDRMAKFWNRMEKFKKRAQSLGTPSSIQKSIGKQLLGAEK